MSTASAVGSLIPATLRRRLDRHRLRRDLKASVGRSRRDVFAEIYDRNLWGGAHGTYSSGTGSAGEAIGPYATLVRALIAGEGITKVVDLGCGDFAVGARILSPGIAYVGCDLHPPLIARNRALFGAANIAFRVADIVTDPLPEGDLCIIRQVFQHLPNGDIARVLAKTRPYRLVLVTDEQIAGDEATANADIPPYHGTRRVFGQGLKLERAPFFTKGEVLLQHSAGSAYGAATGAHLRTVLLRNEADAA